MREGDPPSKRAILRAALELFVRNGLAGTNVRMIGEEAGYTNPAMFKFFESKDALASYLFERCYDRLQRSIQSATAGRPFREALGSLVGTFVALMDEDLEAVLFVQDTLRELWPRMPAALRKRSIVRTLRELVERGIRDGDVTGYSSPDVPVAAILGLFAQFGRTYYFGEFERPASRRQAEIELAVLRILKA